ncbi:MAG: hypothetical protein R3E32_29405 [Chitinophagales bacterium]
MFNRFTQFFHPPKYPFFLKNRTDVIFIHVTKTGGTSIRQSLPFNQVKGTSYLKHNCSKDIIQFIDKKNGTKPLNFPL